MITEQLQAAPLPRGRSPDTMRASIARVGMPQSPSPEVRKALYSSAKLSSYKQCTARLHHVDIPVEIQGMEAVLSGLRWPRLPRGSCLG